MKNHFKKFIIFIAITTLISCATSSYKISKIGDEFSDPNGPNGFILEDNHIDFQDPLGAVPSSEIKPYVFKNKKTNEVIECGFNLINIRMDGAYSNESWLVIDDGYAMIFLTDNDRVVLEAKNTKMDHYTSGYNNISRSYTTYYYDIAWYPCSPLKFKTIAYSNSLKIKVMGNKGNETYGTNRSFLSSFQPNIKRFYDEEIDK